MLYQLSYIGVQVHFIGYGESRSTKNVVREAKDAEQWPATFNFRILLPRGRADLVDPASRLPAGMPCGTERDINQRYTEASA